MASCAKCGKQLGANVKFCPSCGAPVSGKPAARKTASAAKTAKPAASKTAKPVAAKAGAAKTTKPAARKTGTAAPKTSTTTPKTSASDAEQNKGMAIIAYLLFFIPLITGDHRKSVFVKFHTNQGTVLFLASIAFGIVFGIVTAIFSAILIGIGAWGMFAILSTILGLLWLGPLILCILGIVNAATGKMQPLPIIGKFNIIK